MAEIKGRDPVRTARNAGFLSVLIASVLFLTTTISFVVVLGKEEIVDAGEILGALFIRKVYGDTAANVIFPVLIGISTFGGTVAMVRIYGYVRFEERSLNLLSDLVICTDVEGGWPTRCSPICDLLESSRPF